MTDTAPAQTTEPVYFDVTIPLSRFHPNGRHDERDVTLRIPATDRDAAEDVAGQIAWLIVSGLPRVGNHNRYGWKIAGYGVAVEPVADVPEKGGPMADQEAAVDYWPTPDASTYVKAARVRARIEGYDKTLDRPDFERLVARYAADPTLRAIVEATWEDRLPTPDAYYRTCRALEKYRLRGEVLAGEVDNFRAALAAMCGEEA